MAPVSLSDETQKDYRSNSLWRLTLRRIVRQRNAVLGMIILAFLLVAAFGADIIAPFDPNQVLIGLEDGVKKRQDPCIHLFGCPEDQPQHIMGTDGNVRDQFSRILYGSRVSLNGWVYHGRFCHHHWYFIGFDLRFCWWLDR